MVKKILFITLSNIGDAVMTTPTLIFLKKKYPTSKFDIVCDQRSYEIFEYFPFVENIFIKKKKASIAEQISLIKQLRQTYYDLAVDLRTDLMLFFIRAKQKFYKINNKKIHSVKKHFLSVNKNLNLIPETKLFIPKKILDSVNSYFILKEKILCIAIGANSNHKIWPLKNFLDLMIMLKNHFHHVVLVGDNKDNIKAKYILKNYPFKISNFCGKLTLIETAAVIQKSNLFIGNDSGLGHIASAVNTKSLTIFGEGNPARYRPWGKKALWYQDPNQEIKSIKPHELYSLLI